MVWVILGLTAAIFALVSLVAYRRAPVQPDHPVRARALVCVLAVVAAAIAGVAAGLAFSDETVEFQPIGPVVLFADAIGGLAVAVVAASDRGRATSFIALLVAGIWLAIGLGTLPFELAVSACACASVGPQYVAPSVLGLEARTWILLADTVGPALLLLIGFMQSRVPRAVVAPPMTP